MPEDLLRKYRPAGPPPDLRQRVCGGESLGGAALYGPPRLAWPWAVAAAALLAWTIGIHLQTLALAANALGQRPDRLSVDTRVAALTEALGGSEDARRTALLLVAKEELERRLPPPIAIPAEER